MVPKCYHFATNEFASKNLIRIDCINPLNPNPPLNPNVPNLGPLVVIVATLERIYLIPRLKVSNSESIPILIDLYNKAIIR